MKKSFVMPGLVDPHNVPDIFTEGIGGIEKIGRDCLRFTYFTTRDLGDGEIERLIVARSVWPQCNVLTAIQQINAVIAGHSFLHEAPRSKRH